MGDWGEEPGYYDQAPVCCPTCSTPLQLKTGGPTSKNPGRHFYTCDNHQPKWFMWADLQRPDGSFPESIFQSQAKRPRFQTRPAPSSLPASSGFASSSSYAGPPAPPRIAVTPPAGTHEPMSRVLELLKTLVDRQVDSIAKTADLQKKVEELERTNRMMVGLLRDCMAHEEDTRQDILASNAAALLASTPG